MLVLFEHFAVVHFASKRLLVPLTDDFEDLREGPLSQFLILSVHDVEASQKAKLLQRLCQM